MDTYIAVHQRDYSWSLTASWPLNRRMMLPVATSHRNTCLSPPQEAIWLLSFLLHSTTYYYHNTSPPTDKFVLGGRYTYQGQGPHSRGHDMSWWWSPSEGSTAAASCPARHSYSSSPPLHNHQICEHPPSFCCWSIMLILGGGLTVEADSVDRALVAFEGVPQLIGKWKARSTRGPLGRRMHKSLMARLFYLFFSLFCLLLKKIKFL